MARLYLFVEGQTERTFADILLKPHLATHGVYLHKPILIANARKKGKVHRVEVGETSRPCRMTSGDCSGASLQRMYSLLR